LILISYPYICLIFGIIFFFSVFNALKSIIYIISFCLLYFCCYIILLLFYFYIIINIYEIIILMNLLKHPLFLRSICVKNRKFWLSLFLILIFYPYICLIFRINLFFFVFNALKVIIKIIPFCLLYFSCYINLLLFYLDIIIYIYEIIILRNLLKHPLLLSRICVKNRRFFLFFFLLLDIPSTKI